MQGKKEARRTWKSGRASVNEDKRIIAHGEWERGCRMLPVPFAVGTVLYALMLACGVGA
ncbi:MAG: hypothetical protein E7C06_04375 [Eggerthella lenta]|nr:hypothetical protein [Eggerthella lenta]